ncbi:hypothetical protein MCUN1_001145 [Malassezia cuniculi]|uniref:Synaptobrevin homolog YKT6 n=1 Tax=Malassezia cuniculi TaxID=948313 RepID=A0AAF0JAH4_9BASI|nr:hypothetical protein MCUN1_001145 [Malassezia cuniculi]
MIVLALVAANSEVVYESHAAEHARFLAAAQSILGKITPESPARLSYAFESWLFHYVIADGHVFLAVADAAMGRRIPFAFLAQLQKAYQERGDGDFSAKLEALRNSFSGDAESDPIRRAQAELGSVKDVITQNVEQILSRGEQIDLLMDRTDVAANQSLAFRRRAVSLRRSMWWRNTKITALIVFCIILVLLYLFS